MLFSKSSGLFQFGAVQSNGFLYKYMLSALDSPAHEINMRIMRSRNIDSVHIRISEHFAEIRKDFFYSVFFSERDRFGMRPVAYCKQFLP